jgi:hypothetical protein
MKIETISSIPHTNSVKKADLPAEKERNFSSVLNMNYPKAPARK